MANEKAENPAEEPVDLDGFVWQEGNREPVPDAGYYAILAGVEGTPASEYQGKQLAPGLRWNWEVNNGPHKGRRIGRITGRTPSDKNKCGDFMRGVLGRTPKPGERVGLRDCIGRLCLVVVKDGKAESVSLPPQQ